MDGYTICLREDCPANTRKGPVTFTIDSRKFEYVGPKGGPSGTGKGNVS